MSIRTVLCVCAVALAWAPAVGAQETEQLHYPSLPDFQLGHSQQQGGSNIREWVPRGQTVHNWQRMVTVQSFTPGRAVADFQRIMDALWRNSCPGGQTTPVSEGEENGYRYALWLSDCPKNPATGKPEIIWMKAIAGKNTLYLAQYAFRYHPSEQEVRTMAVWMKQVGLTPAAR